MTQESAGKRFSRKPELPCGRGARAKKPDCTAVVQRGRGSSDDARLVTQTGVELCR